MYGVRSTFGLLKNKLDRNPLLAQYNLVPIVPRRMRKSPILYIFAIDC